MLFDLYVYTRLFFLNFLHGPASSRISLYMGEQLYQLDDRVQAGFSLSNSASKFIFRKRSLFFVGSLYVCVYFPTTNTLARREKEAVGMFVHCIKLTALAF